MHLSSIRKGYKLMWIYIPELGFSSRDFGSKYHNLYSTTPCLMRPIFRNPFNGRYRQVWLYMIFCDDLYISLWSLHTIISIKQLSWCEHHITVFYVVLKDYCLYITSWSFKAAHLLMCVRVITNYFQQNLLSSYIDTYILSLICFTRIDFSE
jgi:hypothetical protein